MTKKDFEVVNEQLNLLIEEVEIKANGKKEVHYRSFT
jgi:hypothetical protein